MTHGALAPCSPSRPEEPTRRTRGRAVFSAGKREPRRTLPTGGRGAGVGRRSQGERDEATRPALPAAGLRAGRRQEGGGAPGRWFRARWRALLVPRAGTPPLPPAPWLLRRTRCPQVRTPPRGAGGRVDGSSQARRGPGAGFARGASRGGLAPGPASVPGRG